MLYEKELSFLRETFKKRHLQITEIALTDTLGGPLNADIDEIFGNNNAKKLTLSDVLGDIEPQTVYRYTDCYKLCYTYFLLPSQSMKMLLVIGPYLKEPLSEKQIAELGNSYNVPEKNYKYLIEYYSTIPLFKNDSQFSLMLDTFCELIWQNPSFKIIDTSTEHKIPPSPINENNHSEGFDDIIVNMKALERRYDFENEFMKAVTLGQLHKEEQLLAAFSEQSLEKRTPDSIRNVKNYCIIMNTLLRKSAENGGVHPVYLDRISSDFAIKIEQLATVADTGTLMREMFRSYCRLVRRHSLKSYSLVVQKAILLIDSDLAADLSLSTLATSQNVSPGYLSTIFRKETGKTVSGYIREKRMKHAAHLLVTTKLQIQTVALQCGIMDMQYFSKIFKKHTGKTPKEYREQVKQLN